MFSAEETAASKESVDAEKDAEMKEGKSRKSAGNLTAISEEDEEKEITGGDEIVVIETINDERNVKKTQENKEDNQDKDKKEGKDNQICDEPEEEEIQVNIERAEEPAVNSKKKSAVINIPSHDVRKREAIRSHVTKSLSQGMMGRSRVSVRSSTACNMM